MSAEVITPHRARLERKAIRERLAELRRDLATIRILRRGTLIEREEAESMLVMAYWKRESLRSHRRWLRSVRIEKGSAWSPAACARRGIA